MSAEIEIVAREPCSACDGSGRDEDPRRACPACWGLGKRTRLLSPSDLVAHLEPELIRAVLAPHRALDSL